MARYIDADALLEHYKRVLEHAQTSGMYNHAKLYERFILSIKDATTADVAPNSEVENYKQIAEYQQKLAMDRYFEIKRLEEEIETLKDNTEHLAVMLEEAKQAYANYEETSGLKQAKQEVAREIFEEIEKYVEVALMNGHIETPILCIGHSTFAKLKKKYTEET